MTSGGVPKLTLRQERAAFIRNRERLQDRAADQITAFSGSMAFVYLHVIWFALWCIGNLIWWRFDPFPFGLLTLIVSVFASYALSRWGSYTVSRLVGSAIVRTSTRKASRRRSTSDYYRAGPSTLWPCRRHVLSKVSAPRYHVSVPEFALLPPRPCPCLRIEGP